MIVDRKQLLLSKAESIQRIKIALIVAAYLLAWLVGRQLLLA
jgi:hypothetical protein